ILSACFVILFFNSGARIAFSVLFNPMVTELEWNRGTISSAFFLHMTVFALSLIVVGRFYDRHGPKWVIIIATLFLTAGYTLTAWIDQLWQFYLAYGVLAAIGIGGTSVPLVASLMSKWFHKWRGFAISLTLCGNALGQFILVPLLTQFLHYYDWRTAYLAIGGVVLMINLTLAITIIRSDPEAMGLTPFGYDEEETSPEGSSSQTTRDYTLAEALRTRSLWLFLIAMFVCGGGDFLISTHLIPWVTDYGVSMETAGHMLAWYGLLSMVGLLVVGPASDLIGNKVPIALTFLIRIILFVWVLRMQTPAVFYTFALAFGFTHLMTAPLTPTLVGKLYGFSHIGVIAGLVTTVHHLSGGFWTYVGGLSFDLTGSYQPAFIISAIMALVALVCCLWIREERHHH
ncbi:MFS transporter, partial [Candidatus Entotheonella palauensis]